MDGLMDMIIQGVDFEILNVQPGDALKGKLYVGHDGKIGTGTIEDRGSPLLSLELNSGITLPAGKYSGGTVQQNIPTMGETRITPGSKQITIYTNGMYMTGNVIVERLANLVPENIKLGEYVGGVGPGTWQGYVVTDPATFYYYGTFGPGQSLQDFFVEEFDFRLRRTNYRDHIEFYRYAGNGPGSFLTFPLPLDITTKNKLTLEILNSNLETSGDIIYTVYLSQNKYTNDVEMGKDYVLKREISFGKSSNNKKTSFEIDVSGYSRSIYLMMRISAGLKCTTNIYAVKFT